MESIKLIAFFVAKVREVVYSKQKQHLELTVAHIICFSWQNSGWEKKNDKNNWPARYDLNQIPYKFAVDIMNRFKELELVNSVPEEL